MNRTQSKPEGSKLPDADEDVGAPRAVSLLAPSLLPPHRGVHRRPVSFLVLIS